MSDVQIAVIDQQDTQIVLAVPGVQGATGSSIPSGGTTDQVLRKNSSTDYDANWAQVTSAMIANGTIVNDDINNSAAIAGTKISPDFGGQAVTTTGQVSAARVNVTNNTPPSNGIYLPSANNVAISTGGSGRLFVGANGDITLLDNGLYLTKTGLGNGQITFDGNTYSLISNSSSARLILGTTSTERLSITSTGTVNIKGAGSAGSTQAVSFNGSAPVDSLVIDSSGRLLVGTSSSSAEAKFIVQGGATGSGGGMNIQRSVTTASAGSTIGFIDFTNSSNNVGATVIAEGDGTWSAGTSHPTRLVFSTWGPDSTTSPTERMKISNNGRTLINHADNDSVLYLQSSATSGYTERIQSIVFANYAPNNTSARFIYFADTAAVRAEIRSNGGLANYQANDVNLSDRNAKKDISPAAGTWDCIKEWEIVNYRYKDQPDDADLNLGVIAQQVAESCPEVITVFEEAKDDQPEKLGVKEQQMYWMAIKALQEAMERIEVLEQRLTDAGIA